MLTLASVLHGCVSARGAVAAHYAAVRGTAHDGDPRQHALHSTLLLWSPISSLLLQKYLTCRVITLTGRYTHDEHEWELTHLLQCQLQLFVYSTTQTWYTGDAQHMGITHIKLVDQRAGLVCVNNDHFTGWMSAGQNPHAAAHGVGLVQLFRLKEEEIPMFRSCKLIQIIIMMFEIHFRHLFS